MEGHGLFYGKAFGFSLIAVEAVRAGTVVGSDGSVARHRLERPTRFDDGVVGDSCFSCSFNKSNNLEVMQVKFVF